MNSTTRYRFRHQQEQGCQIKHIQARLPRNVNRRSCQSRVSPKAEVPINAKNHEADEQDNLNHETGSDDRTSNMGQFWFRK